MNYYSLKQAIELIAAIAQPFDMPQIADLCRQGKLTPVFYYGRWAIEIKDEPNKPKYADEKSTWFYSGYLTHERLINLLHNNTDKLLFNSAIAYEEQKTDAWKGACYEIALKANDVNINRFINDENYSLYRDDDSFPVTLQSLLFPADEVDRCIDDMKAAQSKATHASDDDELSDNTAKSYQTTIGLLLELLTTTKDFDKDGKPNEPRYNQTAVVTAIIEQKIYGQGKTNIDKRLTLSARKLEDARKAK